MIISILEAATPILLAALGGLLTERAGVLNIALEGMILTGAFWAVVAVSTTGNPVWGVGAGVLAGVVVGALFVVLALSLGANIFIVGLGLNLLSLGLNQVASTWIFGTSGVLQLDAGLPFLGPSLFTYVAWLLVPAMAILLRHHPAGLRIRVAGSAPELLRARGIPPERPRALALLISGALSGLAGAGLALRLGAYLPGISGGRGWIALVVIFLGYRRPVGVLLATLAFALAESLAIRAQGLAAVSPTLLLSLPYLMVFVALVVYAALRRAALGGQGEE